MGPKRLPAKISEIQLTSEEIDAAKKVLQAADQKRLNSIKQGLKSFLSANPDSSITKDNRYNEEFMLNFIGHQNRCQEAQKKIVTSKEIITEKTKFSDVVRMSAEVMDRELGKSKAELWRTVLKPLPDLLTGRTEAEYLEYPVPKNWERMSESEMKKFLLETQGEATAEDAELAMERKGPAMELSGSVASSSGVNPNEVKVEPADPEEQKKKDLALKVAKLQSELPQLVREFQDKTLELKLIQTKAKNKNDPYHAEFRTDLETCLKKMKSTKGILERLHTEEADAKEMPKLVKQLDDIRQKYDQIEEFSKKNGYKEEAKPPMKRARKATA